jgi:hypothetical protein
MSWTFSCPKMRTAMTDLIKFPGQRAMGENRTLCHVDRA